MNSLKRARSRAEGLWDPEDVFGRLLIMLTKQIAL
jgi:hypothetical protein